MTGKDNNTNRPVTNSTSRVSSKPGSGPTRAEPSKEVGVARGSFQPRKPQPQIPSKAKSAKASDRPRLTPQEARETYYKWLERHETKALEDQETKVLLDSTRELTTRLGEPNILAVYRLIEIFGLPLVEEITTRALALHKKAAEQGESAYKPRENPKDTRPEYRLVGTEVGTAKGAPRTPGGIFFFLMRGYVIRIRLAWEDLRIPWLPEVTMTIQNNTSTTDAESQTNESEPGKVSKGSGSPKQVYGSEESGPKRSAGNIPSSLMVGPAVAKAGSSTIKDSGVGGAPVTGEQEVKPSRGKVVITGSPKPGSELKVAPQGLAEVMELMFEIEPGANPAKGLPVLEKTLVKAWFTAKQYNKIKDSLNPNSRYLIEGEIGAGINSQNFEPFIRVICTRLTTIELDQEAKQKKAEQSNPA